MNITLAPPMSTQRKRQAKIWLTAQLISPELADSTTPMNWIAGGIAIYVDGGPKIVQAGHWSASESQAGRTAAGGYFTICCGGVSNEMPSKAERLAILGGIISATDLWGDLAEAYSAALGRTLLEAYSSCCMDMVQAPKPATKLAFSADKQQVALQYTDEPDVWYLNNGQLAEVDNSWQQVPA